VATTAARLSASRWWSLPDFIRATAIGLVGGAKRPIRLAAHRRRLGVTRPLRDRDPRDDHGDADQDERF
jgi:hypothetical protein